MKDPTKDQKEGIERQIDQNKQLTNTLAINKRLFEKIVSLNKKLYGPILKKTSYIGNQFKQQTATAILAAFGFLIALAWRDFISKAIQENIKVQLLSLTYPNVAELATAVIVTLIAIIGIMFVSKWAKSEQTVPQIT